MLRRILVGVLFALSSLIACSDEPAPDRRNQDLPDDSDDDLDPETVTIQAIAGAGGSIVPASLQVVVGETGAFTVTPDVGHEIAGVSGCGGTLDGASFSTAAVVEDCQVEATFEKLSYAIGGTVAGLEGAGLILQLNGGGDLPITANGSFVFTTPLDFGSTYAVTVAQQPGEPAQICSVEQGAGEVEDTVTNIQVSCITQYPLAVTVAGLEGGSVLLRTHAGDELLADENGTYVFTALYAEGTDYTVTVATQPATPGRSCKVHGATGTLERPAWARVQCSNYALHFGGGNGQVTFAPDLPLPANGAAYTVEAWIRPEQMGLQGIVTWGNLGSDNQSMVLGLTATALQVSWRGSGNVLEAPVSDLSDTWHHVAATWDGATRKLFLDGVEVAAEAAALHAVPDGSNFRIGQGFAGQFFNGAIDDVRIWGAPLTAATLQAWRFTDVMDEHPHLADLVGAWSFRAGLGDKVTEATGKGTAFNGLLEGDVTWERVHARVSVTPAALRINTDGSPAALAAAAYDEYHNPVSIATWSWESDHAARVTVVGDGADAVVQSTTTDTGFGHVTVAVEELGASATALIYARPLGTSGTRQVIMVNHLQQSNPVRGVTWGDAFARLDEALLVAGEYDDIWVAEGTYTPSPGSDRRAGFNLKNGMRIYGGFDGVDTRFNRRNPGTYVTTLSGVLPDGISRSYQVVKGVNLDATALFDGFTITGGRADGLGDLGSGGGLFLLNSAPTLGQLVFRGNQAVYGGGLAATASNVTLTNAYFEANTATTGGGLYADGGSLQLTTVDFTENLSSSAGGGFRTVAASPVTVSDVSLLQNSASSGGGAYVADAGSASFSNSVFEGNLATTSGGGLWGNGSVTLSNVNFQANVARSSGGGMWSQNNHGFFTDVVFSENSVENTDGLGSGGGGGLYLTSGMDVAPQMNRVQFLSNHARTGGAMTLLNTTPVITNSLFRGNHVTTQDHITPAGGAIWLQTTSNLTTTLTNVVFVGNTATTGGAIYGKNQNSYVRMTRLNVQNATFAGNAGRPGGILFTGRYLRVKNSIMWDNDSTTSGFGTNLHHFYDVNDGTDAEVVVEDSLLEGGCTLDSISGNHSTSYSALTCTNVLTADPLFVQSPVGTDGIAGTGDDIAGNLQLQAGSPALDVGDNTVFDGVVSPVDLAASPRIVNTTVDLGAYERQ